MIHIPFLKKLTFIVALVSLTSCDKDFNSIGGNIIGNENFLIESQDFAIKAYNQKIGSVQTNNLPINPLGVINSPIFGKTKANFVTQLQIDPRSLNRVFGENKVIDSVVLSIPYFSTRIDNFENGTGKYNLESTYTDNANPSIYDPISFQVYENGFFLRDFDPNQNNEVSQKYYSNEDATFNAAKLALLNSQPNFIADNREVILYKPDSTVNKTVVPYITEYTLQTDPSKSTRQAPSLRVKLNNTFFMDRILGTAPSNLSNNSIFKNYFKGLYFNVDDAASGSLYNLDFAKGKVIIYYKEDLLTTLEGQSFNSRPRKTFVMNLTGNSVSLLNNTDNTAYATATNNPNLTSGDELLYLKGGEGSQAFIELFSATELADLRISKPLINRATITFTIDDNYILNNNKPEPLRIYLYNSDNNIPITDYNFDTSTNPINPRLNKSVYGGIVQLGSNNKGIKYVIDVTEHVNAIINNRSENVRLGVAITDNIGFLNYSSLKNPITIPKLFNRTPTASVVSSLGTVLYGSNTPAALNGKKVNFKIYYTKPN